MVISLNGTKVSFLRADEWLDRFNQCAQYYQTDRQAYLFSDEVRNDSLLHSLPIMHTESEQLS